MQKKSSRPSTAVRKTSSNKRQQAKPPAKNLLEYQHQLQLKHKSKHVQMHPPTAERKIKSAKKKPVKKQVVVQQRVPNHQMMSLQQQMMMLSP